MKIIIHRMSIAQTKNNRAYVLNADKQFSVSKA